MDSLTVYTIELSFRVLYGLLALVCVSGMKGEDGLAGNEGSQGPPGPPGRRGNTVSAVYAVYSSTTLSTDSMRNINAHLRDSTFTKYKIFLILIPT